MAGSKPPIVLAQEVRASPPNPSMVNDKLVKPRPVRGANPVPPNVVNRGTFQRVPVAAILQGGGMNGFAGAPPIVLAQPVQGANPSANAAAPKILVNRQSPRAAPLAPPRVVNRGTFQRAPVASILQGGGMNGIAGLAAAPSVSGGGLESMNKDMSVSAQQRAKKAIEGSAAPIVGDYTDAIRQAAGFAFGPKRMPGQGFAASGYSYPSQQMVVGATLAGVPIIAPPPMPPMPNMASPQLASKAGIKGQISTSPSEERRQLLSTLMGLGSLGAADRFTDPNREEVKYCNRTYPPGVNAQQDRLNDLCRIDSGFFGSPPWTIKGKAERSLPTDWQAVQKAVVTTAEQGRDLYKQQTGGGGGGGGAPATGGGGGGAMVSPIVFQYKPPVTYQPPAPPAKKANTALIVGGAVAAVAVLGGVAYFAMKK